MVRYHCSVDGFIIIIKYEKSCLHLINQIIGYMLLCDKFIFNFHGTLNILNFKFSHLSHIIHFARLANSIYRTRYRCRSRIFSHLQFSVKVGKYLFFNLLLLLLTIINVEY